MQQIVDQLHIFNRALQVNPKKYFGKINAYPFLKWAGGKRTLMPYIVQILPERFNDYYEPFLGGGSVFFFLSNQIRKAYLSDINQELMLTYQILKKYPDALVKKLKKHKRKHNKTYYNNIRNNFDTQNSIQLVSQFIYLNKTCYNGLYRVNKEGKFNVPMGSYKDPSICDEINLFKVSKVLKSANLKMQSFTSVKPKRGDLIYCDPPYDNTFTAYTKEGFNREGQKELKKSCDRWRKAGAYVIVSNNDTSFIKKLYKGYKFIPVKMARNINCKSEKRKKVSELLILGY